MVSSFFNLLYSFMMSRGGEDRIFWTFPKGGRSRSDLFYHVLCPPAGFSFPWKSIWRNKAPPRVVFFVWIATLGDIFDFG
jgi:hypothetical protein